MTGLAASVIVLSRGDPVALHRCLLAVSQQQYDQFEVIVVASDPVLETLSETPFASEIKGVTHDMQNVSDARNAGVAVAAGAFIAFLDEHSVPEPTWLHFLAQGFARDGVSAVAGYVRGFDGITFWQTAHHLTPDGALEHIALDPRRVTVPPTPAGGAIHTPRINMAFSRAALVTLGGFDTAFREALEVTDLNMRLAHAGLKTAIVPMAEVHWHRRDLLSAVPRDLFDLGAGWAVFQRKNLPATARPAHWRRLRRTARLQAMAHLVSGQFEPRDIAAHLQRLDAGYQQGMERKSRLSELSEAPAAAFQPFPAQTRSSIVMHRRAASGMSARIEAMRLVAAGHIVTLVMRGWSPAPPRVLFDDMGFWEHSGAIYRPADAEGGKFRPASFRNAVKSESTRVENIRTIPLYR